MFFSACKHKWEIKINETGESKADVVQRLGYTINYLLDDLHLKRKYILMVCTECGKVHETTEEI